jgi:hypothetical protein
LWTRSSDTITFLPCELAKYVVLLLAPLPYPVPAPRCSPIGVNLMTKTEKERLSAIIRATEYLFLENIALKLVLEHREVPNWQKLVDHLLTDKEMLAGVRLKFRDLYSEIEKSGDPSAALKALLGVPAAPKKAH